jgi:hypothetical protein
MEKESPPESDLTAEFRQLGDNLRETLRTAWESEERRRLQEDLEAGLSALETALNETADEVTRGDTGQRIKAEVQDLEKQVKSGQLQAKARDELLSVLQRINLELQRLRDSMNPPSDTDATPLTEES